MLYSQSLIYRRLILHDKSKNIANNLTLHTCEIEEVRSREISDLVVIGYVTSTDIHPDADKLTVCQVDAGSYGTFQICCGADNIGSDMFVPVALPGAYLSSINLTIGARKLRGVESNGMICAKEELGIAEDAEAHGIRILSEDFDDITSDDIGVSFAKKYSRIENTIYDVENKTITHRPDLMGHAGIARELYAIYNQENGQKIKKHNLDQFLSYAQQSIDYLAHTDISSDISIETDHCRAYYTINIENTSVQKSTFHTRLQLIDLELAPKNNWVDFSNIFMYQTGQPIHCFDSDTIEGKITVRQAKEGESFVDLMEIEYALTEKDIVIADEKNILALAGVIGGHNSAVSENTKNITIELANFDPIIVRKTAIRHGVRTDASARFEKNISPLMTQGLILALRDTLDYLHPDIGEAKRTNFSAPRTTQQTPTIIDRKIADLKRIIGNIPEEKMNKALTMLGFVVKEEQVIVPRRRSPKDITLKADVAEEVVRIIGYDNLTPRSIPTTISHHTPSAQPTRQRRIENIITQRYTGDSVETYPRAPDALYEIFDIDTSKLTTLQNPLQPEQSHLSHSLLYNLLALVIKNHKFYDTIRPYTIGSVRGEEKDTGYANTRGNISQKTPQTTESRQIGGILYDAISSDDLLANILTAKHICQDIVGAPLEFRATKIKQFHPRQQAEVIANGLVIGFVGRIHPLTLDKVKLPTEADLVYYTLDLAALENLSTEKSSEYKTLQDQILTRDISFVIDRKQSIEPITTEIRKVNNITDISIFDVYQGEHLPNDKKSVAIQITIHHLDNNLTTDQINDILNQAIEAGKKTGAVLREDFVS